MIAECLPAANSIAMEISPNVALSLAASTARANKFPSPDSAASVIASSFSITLSSFRLARNCSSFAIWLSRTAVLSTSRISRGSSFSKRYLLTPTIVSNLESIFAWRLAAASSILILGMPVSIAFAMPPNDSISSMCFHAFSISSFVNDST